MLALLKALFPINRSLTGDGVRQTLRLLQAEIGDLNIHEIPSGTQAFDWVVPEEWNIKEAYLVTPNGERICDYQTNNLHLVGYSTPVNTIMTLEELQPHLHSLPDSPTAIPYVTTYYERKWGFCLSHSDRQNLSSGKYQVVIQGRLGPGHLTYGEVMIPATKKTNKEVFFSTYVCHPSMANNELSGPVVATFLARWLHSLPIRRYNYRFFFGPETIGSIVYLSRHLAELKERVEAGFNLTCVGDDQCYSFVPSRTGNTLADRVALHVLKFHDPEFHRYSYLDRGSDERQYCAPGIDLPVVTMCRSKYHNYPEYHSSLDNMDFVSEDGLQGALLAHQRVICCLENNQVLQGTVLGEPQLGRRGLYPLTGTRDQSRESETILNLLAYCDGRTSLLDIAEIIGMPMWELFPLVKDLKGKNLLRSVDHKKPGEK